MPNLNKRIRSNSMESSSSDNTIVPNLNLSPEQLSQIAVMVAELLKPSIETIIQTTVSEIFKQNSNNLNNINTINKNNQNHNQNSPLWGQPPSFITDNNLFSKMAAYAAENPDTINKKSKIAVVERMPFISEEDDKRIVDEIVSKCNLGDKLDKNTPPFRHKTKYSQTNSSRPQLIKIPFIDNVSRNYFIQQFHSISRTIPQFLTMYLLAVTLVLLSYNFCINYVGMPTH
uniref:Uncharacterized protein n=1 Tax=Meloidogyne enterolobii TaxID=390850 RepID=A0A6V7XB25_MELEN|nr:unnamed protein product [Meloidogyne enterolobii]